MWWSAKGQLISKANQSSRGFSQKTNENTSHISKNEFIRSFLGESSVWRFVFEIKWPLETYWKTLYETYSLLTVSWTQNLCVGNFICIFDVVIFWHFVDMRKCIVKLCHDDSRVCKWMKRNLVSLSIWEICFTRAQWTIHVKIFVKTFWESHRIWQKSWFYSVASKQVVDFFKFLWPFQKSLTLMAKGQLISKANCQA